MPAMVVKAIKTLNSSLGRGNAIRLLRKLRWRKVDPRGGRWDDVPLFFAQLFMGERRGRGGGPLVLKNRLWVGLHIAPKRGGGARWANELVGSFSGGEKVHCKLWVFSWMGEYGVGRGHTAYIERGGEAPDKKLFSDSFLTFMEHKNSHDRGRLTGRGVYCLINLPNRERRRHTYMQSRFWWETFFPAIPADTEYCLTDIFLLRLSCHVTPHRRDFPNGGANSLIQRKAHPETLFLGRDERYEKWCRVSIQSERGSGRCQVWERISELYNLFGRVWKADFEFKIHEGSPTADTPRGEGFLYTIHHAGKGVEKWTVLAFFGRGYWPHRGNMNAWTLGVQCQVDFLLAKNHMIERGDCFLTKAFAEKNWPLPCQTTKTNFLSTLPIDEKNQTQIQSF